MSVEPFVADVLYSLRVRLGTLQHELLLASALYLDGQDERDPTVRRQAAMHALRATIEFLESIDDFKQARLTLPFEGLFSALDEADKGSADPILEPRRPSHRPLDTEFETHLKAYAAVAMSLWMRCGDKERRAGEKVAKALAQAGFRLPGKRGRRPDATTVKNWRAKCIGHHGGSRIGRAYERLLAWIETVGMVNEETANRMLDGLVSFVRERNLLKSPS
jgi:hypothetical protein